MLDGAEATIQDVDINLKISTLTKGHKYQNCQVVFNKMFGNH